MLIGSAPRAILRITVYVALTLPLLPIQFILNLVCKPAARWLPVYYHRAVCYILGLKVRVRGTMSPARPTLFACNHISYLDIEVLGSLIPGSFIAKREVSTWPFFSWLAKLQRSVFVERKAHASMKSNDEITKRLRAGDDLILFPEGTSSEGTYVLPFRSSFFAAAQVRRKDGKPITVQPVSIAYTRLDGIPLGRHWRPFYTWFGDMNLGPHAWQMAGLGEVEVMVNFHEPVDIDQLGDRKKLSAHCQKVIAQGVAASNSGRFEVLPPAMGEKAAGEKAAGEKAAGDKAA
ncbi:MAG: lysophospholipid acyltransferase family protein [Rhodospirillales bacterium]